MPTGQLRIVLATLLLSAGSPASVGFLCECVWGENVPATARTILQGYVSRLRKLLSTSRRRTESVLIITQPTGYQLTMGPQMLDLHRFDTQVQRAAQEKSAGKIEQAAETLQTALNLWRGEPLQDIASETLHRTYLSSLKERRLASIEEWADLQLALGRHNNLTSDLDELSTTNPLRERLQAQFMQALWRAGRRADALHVYRQTRQHLVDELGIEPGPILQKLHQEILTDGSRLTVAAGSGPGATSASHPSLLSSLSTGVQRFTGRQRELDTVCGYLTEHPGAALPASATVVVGPPGVGKTAVAVRAAREVSASFPDGQFFVDLHGSGIPVPPAEALGRLLHQFAAVTGGIPAGLDDRVQIFRSYVADRRMLLVLEDARNESQVRPLLPLTFESNVLVTSRSRLDGLLGSGHVTLGPLDDDDATALLSNLVGSDRVARERSAGRRIVARCAGLPIALQIAAARLTARPALLLETLANRLDDDDQCLSELRIGDVDLRASIASSYYAGTPPVQRAFRLLSLIPATFRADLAARVWDIPIDAAELLLGQLTDAHLLDLLNIDARGHALYRFNTLLRVYARECLSREEPAQARRAALSRVIR